MTTLITDHVPSMTSAATWHSVHVYYHDGLDELILDAARPLFEGLDPAVVQAYWVRHWRRGPHLRLNLRTTRRVFTERVWPVMEQELRGYLAAHPSTTLLDERAETARHQRLADAEWELGPLSPWIPNNSVRVEPYDARLHALGGPSSADLLAEFHTGTTGLAFSMLAAVRAGADRLSLALNLMFAYAQVTMPEGIRRGYQSYFSHASGYLAHRAGPEATRAAFDHCYQRNRDRLADQLAAVLDTVDGTGTAAFVPEWLSLVRHYQGRAEKLIASRAISFDHLADQPQASTQPEAQSWRPTTVVDRLGANQAWQREIGDSGWFSRHRLVLNYQYLLLNRLGITPGQRYLLCHLAASTVQEVFGVSAAAAFEEYMAAHPNPEDPEPPERTHHATTVR
ncbi:MAG TPA: thiopeptide maturation pyridine synthase [Pseudonocardiaceae bacterium]|nr:thiopeptide maturation pyridine synthase [Pseudonocardiaceae bacterium]